MVRRRGARFAPLAQAVISDRKMGEEALAATRDCA